jgi:hypothetical protein
VCCVPVTYILCCKTLEDDTATGIWRKYVTEEEQEEAEQQCDDFGGTITGTFTLNECRGLTEEQCQQYGGTTEAPCGGPDSLCYTVADTEDDCLLDVQIYETREEADAAIEGWKENEGFCTSGLQLLLVPTRFGNGEVGAPFPDITCEWEPGSWTLYVVCCTEENPLP